MAQAEGSLRIDAGFGQHGMCLRFLYRTQQIGGNRERIDADVEQGAAAQFPGKQPAMRIELGAKAEVGEELARLADFAVVEQAPRFAHSGQKARPHCFHQE